MKWEEMNWEPINWSHKEEKVQFEGRGWLAHFDCYLQSFFSQELQATAKAWLFEEDNEGSSWRDMFRLAAVLIIYYCNMTLWSSSLTTIDWRGEGKRIVKVEGLNCHPDDILSQVSFVFNKWKEAILMIHYAHFQQSWGTGFFLFTAKEREPLPQYHFYWHLIWAVQLISKLKRMLKCHFHSFKK